MGPDVMAAPGQQGRKAGRREGKWWTCESNSNGCQEEESPGWTSPEGGWSQIDREEEGKEKNL